MAWGTMHVRNILDQKVFVTAEETVQVVEKGSEEGEGTRLRKEN